MDYSKAQTVSVDDCSVTILLVFVTVTKRMTINLDSVGNICTLMVKFWGYSCALC